MTTENNLLKLFNRSAEKLDSVTNEMIAAIILQRPDLKDEVFYKPATGNSAITLFAGNEVFKTGKFCGWDDAIEREGEILTHLKGRGMPVPEMTTIGDEFQLIGMKRLPGVVLWSVYDDLTEGERQALAHDIAAFKVQLEQSAKPRDLTNVKEFGGTLKEAISGMLALKDVGKSLSGYKGLKKELCDYLASMDTRKKVLMHGDLHGNNILVDPKTHRLTAVIDFGSCHFTRVPELEFANQYNVLFEVEYRKEGRKNRYDLPFVKMIEDAYAGTSQVISAKDLACNRLLYQVFTRSSSREARWTAADHPAYQNMRDLIAVTAHALGCPQTRKQQKMPKNG